MQAHSKENDSHPKVQTYELFRTESKVQAGHSGSYWQQVELRTEMVQAEQ